MESWSGVAMCTTPALFMSRRRCSGEKKKKKKVGGGLKMTLVIRRGLWKALEFAQCSPTQCAHYIQAGQCYLERLRCCAELRRSPFARVAVTL